MHEKSHHLHIFSFLFLLVLSDLLHTVEPEIQTIQISSDDRAFILLHDFGFRDPGHISISISSLSITTTTTTTTLAAIPAKALITPTHLSFMGFYYAPTPARHAIKLAILKDTCILGSPFVFSIFTLDKKTDLNRTVLITIPDLYYIFFVNCVKNSTVSMTVNLETYNFDPRNDSPDYMDDHFSNLPTILFIFSIFFFVLLLAWTHACNKNKHFLHRVHILMSILLLLKFLELVSHANSQHSVRQTGTPHVWNILWLTLYSARNGLFVAVIMLIRAEWSIFRPYAICVAVSLQTIASVCFILIRVAGPSSRYYRYWAVTYYATDFLCCVMMVLPVSKFIGHLVGNYSKGKRLTRERVFGNLASTIYVYVGLTRFGVFAMRAVESHQFWFLTMVLDLTIEFVFYVVVYLMFWPNERYEYVALESIGEEDLSA